MLGSRILKHVLSRKAGYFKFNLNFLTRELNHLGSINLPLHEGLQCVNASAYFTTVSHCLHVFLRSGW